MMEWFNNFVESVKLRRHCRKMVEKDFPEFSIVQQRALTDAILDATEETITEAIEQAEHEAMLEELFPEPEEKALFE